MARRLAFVATVAATLLVLPALAHAATYCVNDSACAGVNEPDLQTALTAAMGTMSEADIVQVGDPGTAPSGGWGYSDSGNSANQVQIIGEGPANTILKGPASASTILGVFAPGSTISDLSVQLPNADASAGVATTGSVKNVDVTSLDDGSHMQTGAQLIGAGAQQWIGGAITLPTTGSATHNAIFGGSGTAIVDLEDLALTAKDVGLSTGAGADITLRRVSITAGVAGVNQGSHVTLDNVAYRATPQPAPGIFLITQPSGSHDATSDLNHVTAFGNAENGAYGLFATDAPSRAATVNVRNSILRNFFFLIDRSAGNSGGSANVNVSYSDIDLSHKLDNTGGGATGAINVGPGMIDADPFFTNPTAGDFSLKPGSPAIDAGDPAGLQAGDSPTDVLGAPRISNGRQDMGAVELQVPPPAPSPPPPAKDRLAPRFRLSKLPSKLKLKQLLAGISFTITPSEPSSIDASLLGSAKSVRLAKSFNFTLAHKKLGLASGKRRVTLKVRKKQIGRSRHFSVQLRVVLTDAAGNKTTARRTIKVR